MILHFDLIPLLNCLSQIFVTDLQSTSAQQLLEKQHIKHPSCCHASRMQKPSQHNYHTGREIGGHVSILKQGYEVRNSHSQLSFNTEPPPPILEEDIDIGPPPAGFGS